MHPFLGDEGDLLLHLDALGVCHALFGAVPKLETPLGGVLVTVGLPLEPFPTPLTLQHDELGDF